MGHSSCQAAKFPKLGSPKLSLPLQNPKIRGSFLPRSSKGWERLWGARLAPRMKSGSFQSKLAKPAVDPQMGSPKQALAPPNGLWPQNKASAPKTDFGPQKHGSAQNWGHQRADAEDARGQGALPPVPGTPLTPYRFGCYELPSPLPNALVSSLWAQKLRNERKSSYLQHGGSTGS